MVANPVCGAFLVCVIESGRSYRWYAQVAQFLCLHMVVVGVLFRRLG